MASLAVIVTASFVLLGLPGAANATLKVLTPNPAAPVTFVGHGGYSADGLGQEGVGGFVRADVPAGSKVVNAYLYGTYNGTDLNLAVEDRTIDFDGTTVVLDTLTNSELGDSGLVTARTDVTAQVAAKVGTGGAITNFAVNTDPSDLDGVALVVVYSNPTKPLVTIAILDGGSKQAGDQVTLNFASAVNTATPGFAAQLSLGSGFSYQNGLAGHACGGTQYSTVTVNSSLLTSCAGNFDDGLGANGSLITVGGVGDSLDNPTDPTATDSGTDDELYNLTPFIHTGDTSLVFQTANPSTDDNLFLAVVEITADATVTTENCTNGIDDDGDGLIDAADPDCNHPPAANAQSVTTVQDTAKAITLTGADLDGDALTYATASTPTHGTLSGSGANLTYTPAAGYSGPDSFTFTTSDGKATSTPATVSIRVTPVVAPVNNPPVASPQSVTTAQDTAKAITLAASDADGDALTYAATTPAHGTLSGSGANLTYTPAAGYSGPDSFTFTANDGKDTSAPATVTITVTPTVVVPVNNPPVASPQSVTTAQDTAKAITLAASDADGDALTYAATTPAHGTLSGSGANLTYTPAAGYSGPDSFTFTANDGKDTSAPATVTITVTPAVVVPPTCATNAPVLDKSVSADITKASSQLVAPKLTTAGADELLVAFVEADGPRSATQRATSVTGGGLTWSLATRSNSTWGTTEVWQAHATSTVTNAVVTAKLANSGFDGSITVAAFKGAAAHLGAAAGGAGLTGSPNATVKPLGCNSLVWAAGHDWSTAKTPVAAAGQSLVHAFVDKRVHDSFWTQKVTAATDSSHTPVVVKTTGPVVDRWTMAAVEIPSAG